MCLLAALQGCVCVSLCLCTFTTLAVGCVSCLQACFFPFKVRRTDDAVCWRNPLVKNFELVLLDWIYTPADSGGVCLHVCDILKETVNEGVQIKSEGRGAAYSQSVQRVEAGTSFSRTGFEVWLTWRETNLNSNAARHELFYLQWLKNAQQCAELHRSALDDRSVQDE